MIFPLQHLRCGEERTAELTSLLEAASHNLDGVKEQTETLNRLVRRVEWMSTALLLCRNQISAPAIHEKTSPLAVLASPCPIPRPS